MADKLPDYPALLVTDRPLADAVFVRDASLPAATDAEARAAYQQAVDAIAKLQRIATRRAADQKEPTRAVALSTVERRTAGALADVLAVTLVAGIETVPVAAPAEGKG